MKILEIKHLQNFIEANPLPSTKPPRVDDYVDKVRFQSIIKFWKCMWLLYFKQYHLDKEKRCPPEPVRSYYYKKPDLMNRVTLKNFHFIYTLLD